MLKPFIQIFSSLRLTVTCLVLGCVIVFWGTMAQVQIGLYRAQSEIFRSFLIEWHPAGAAWKIPIFPGGYLVGGVLLINLMVAHVRYYQPGKRKIGIALIHLGIVLLLAGQMLTDVLSVESVQHLRLGEAKNYSESARQSELAVIDITDTNTDKVLAIPCRVLARRHEFESSQLPFQIQVTTYYANSEVSTKPDAGFVPVQVTAGFGSDLWWHELPHETAMEKTDVPSATVAINSPADAIGTFLVSEYLGQPQTFVYQGRQYQLLLRPERYYMPFNLRLLEFKHDKYPGTDIPKNFSSRVRLQRPDTGEDREALIFMNNPLRYAGVTFYQASFDPDDRGSVLQVVHNPGWLTPYLACGLVGVGLLVQFLMHLIPFLKRRNS
ncbi:MAG TPA: cytochrome c biogenesis protein ResB [Candidatus Angelobacter sp.]|nr:cytochrome c biogenesis protein ResB [Candidatus Angelobacter sp.]